MCLLHVRFVQRSMDTAIGSQYNPRHTSPDTEQYTSTWIFSLSSPDHLRIGNMVPVTGPRDAPDAETLEAIPSNHCVLGYRATAAAVTFQASPSSDYSFWTNSPHIDAHLSNYCFPSVPALDCDGGAAT